MDQEKEDTQTKADAQDEILLAALKLFAGKGYFNTSLTDIAEASGVKGTSGIYHHFKNKQMIAAALYANIFDSLNVSIDDIRRKNQKPSEQLRSIVDLLFRLADEAPHVMQLLLVLNINEILPDEKPLLETAPFAKILKIFQAGTKTGEIRNLAPQLCFAYFFGIVNHTLRMVLIGALDKKADAYQSQTWLAAWNAIAKK
ncbi:MAG: TetR/AcrR family transcriptional regulator [Methylomicrobium sp.]